jgi:CheY-like chemotaxis protein
MAKIMLVEDDNNLREIYEARLLAEGYDIVSARDGEEALAMAVREKPDLIISDIMMPKISGFDMLDIIRSTPETKNTKVIMMTALSQVEDKARADKLGADRYLVKSQVTLEDVAKASRDLLESDEVGGSGSSVNNETLPPPSYSEPQQPRREATIMPMQQESTEETPPAIEEEQEPVEEQEGPVEQTSETEPEPETIATPSSQTPVQSTTSDDDDEEDNDEEDDNTKTSQDDTPEIEPENDEPEDSDSDTEKKNESDEEPVEPTPEEGDSGKEDDGTTPELNGFGSDQLGQAEAPGTVISPSGNFKRDEEPVSFDEEDDSENTPEAEAEAEPAAEQEPIAPSSAPSSQTPVQLTASDDDSDTSQDQPKEQELEGQIENFIAEKESQATDTSQTAQEPAPTSTQAPIPTAPALDQATEAPAPTVITPNKPPEAEAEAPAPAPTAPPVVQQESDGKTKTVKGERVLQPLHDPRDNSSLEKLIAEEQAKDVDTDVAETAPATQQQSNPVSNVIKPKNDDTVEQPPTPDTEAEEFLKAANLNNQPSAEPSEESTNNEVSETETGTPQVRPDDISI